MFFFIGMRWPLVRSYGRKPRGLLLLAMSLKAAPALVERLFRTALSDSAAVLGA